MSVLRRVVSRSAGVSALALSIVLVVLPTPQALAVQLFTDNFESGVLVPPWTSTANFTNQTAIVFAGARAGRATTTSAGAYAYKDLSPAQPNVYLKTRIRVVSAGGTTPVLRFRQGGAGTNIISLNRNNSGALVRKNHITATQDATSATTLALNTWYDLQIHALVNGTSSVFEVWLNGTLVSDISGTV